MIIAGFLFWCFSFFILYAISIKVERRLNINRFHCFIYLVSSSLAVILYFIDIDFAMVLLIAPLIIEILIRAFWIIIKWSIKVLTE